MEMEQIFFSGTFGGELLSLAAAKSVLEALGLRVTVDTNQLSSRWGIAKVKGASVKAGTTLRRGDAVTIISR